MTLHLLKLQVIGCALAVPHYQRTDGVMTYQHYIVDGRLPRQSSGVITVKISKFTLQTR